MNVFKQEIVNVQASSVLVKSTKGNIYPVIVSDQVRLSGRTPKIGDTGVIHRVNGKYYLFEVIPKNKLEIGDEPLWGIGYEY